MLIWSMQYYYLKKLMMRSYKKHNSFFKWDIRKAKKRKWKIAKFSKQTKRDIFVRDMHCLFCPSTITDYHHVFYGGQAEYWDDRNSRKKWVWLCLRHHELIHHFTDGRSQLIRQQCITYLDNMYDNT